MDEVIVTPAQLAMIERMDTAIALGVSVAFFLLLVVGFLIVRLLRS